MHFKNAPDDGYYLATVVATFDANSNGYREVYIANSNTNTILGRIRVGAAPGTTTIIQLFSGIVVGPGEGIGVYAVQNSGAKLNINIWLSITKCLPYFPELISSGKYQ